jgi:quinol-cytochrome oxidoreductase complex cytochrome b subunit
VNRLSRVYGFFYERLGLEDLRRLASKKQVPIHRSTHFYYFGGMALFLFMVQIVTGILLSLYYKPSPDQAFESVQAIVTEVDYGWLIRSAHAWSANLLVGVLLLHLLTAYLMRAYRRPREITWLTGVVLLGVFMAFGFSGYLLPWNELAFFATRVGTAIVGVVPVIGPQLLLLARGGEDVTGDTLARFYSLHVVVLPLLAFSLLGIHLFLVQKHGMSIPGREGSSHGDDLGLPSMPFVPHFLLRDMVGWYLALALLAALSALFPWDLGVKANPFSSAPEGIHPEWYFLFMFQTLKLIPARLAGLEGDMVGVLFFGLCGLVVLLTPFLDRGRTNRAILNGLAAVAVAFFIVMTAWGWFSKAGEMSLRIILGALLTTIALFLLIPSTRPQTAARRALYGVLTLAVLVLLVAAYWEVSA